MRDAVSYVVRHALVCIAIAAGCRSQDITAHRYQGMVELDQTDSAFEIAGRIASRDVVVGQTVARGQPLAHLDDAIDRQTREMRETDLGVAKAELGIVAAGSRIEDIRAARAELAAAQANEDTIARQVEREQKLVASGAVAAAPLDDLTAQLARARGETESRSQRLRALIHGARSVELKRADARVAAAEATLALADRVLDKHVLVAPVAGFVVDVYPEVGEVVAAGMPIVSIVDRRRPYADVFVPVADLPRVRVGGEVAVAVEGDAREVSGTIERVYPHLEFTPRYVYSPRERPNLMARVRVRIEDRETRLHAGQPAYARLLDRAREARR